MRILSRSCLFAALAAGLCVADAGAEIHTFPNLNRTIPDGDISGLTDTRIISSSVARISEVRVSLAIEGEFNGDLYAYLRHTDETHTNLAILLNRPGSTTTNVHGYADMGLDVIFDDGAPDGDIHFYRRASEPAHGSPCSGVWQPDGRRVGPLEVSESSARTAPLATFLGWNAAGEWTIYLVDAHSGGTNMLKSWGLEIVGAMPSPVSWATPDDIGYGTALSAEQLNATSPVPGSFSYNPPLGTVLRAGDNQFLTVTFTPADTISYLPASASVSINVRKAPLTIAVVDASRSYGAENPSFTATYSGFVNGDSVATLDSFPVLLTSATLSSPVGTYSITASGAADTDYSIAFQPGTLAVTPAALHIIAEDQTKAYGAPLPRLTARFEGLVNGDSPETLAIPPVLSTTASHTSGVGTYSISVDGAADPNYSIQFSSGTLKIAPAALTIRANDQTMIYGDPLPELGAVYEGFVNGDTVSSLDRQPTLSTSATSISSVGVYPITPADAAGANYAISLVPASLTIIPRPLIVSAENKAVTYGVDLPELTATYAGFAPGDNLTSLDSPAALFTSAVNGSPVGSYAITVAGAADPNYACVFEPGTLSITPALLTVRVEDSIKSYGAPIPPFELSYTGFADGDGPGDLDVQVEASTAALPASDVGTYPISLTGGSDRNYTITLVPGTLRITPALVSGLVRSSTLQSKPGEVVRFGMETSVVAPGTGEPSGTVQFTVDGLPIGIAVPLVGNQASLEAGDLPVGWHTIGAVFSGDANFQGTSALLPEPLLINTPPYAGTDRVLRISTNSVKLSIASLLDNDVDPDGHSFQIAGFEGTSTNGAIVAHLGEWVFYTPVSETVAVDAFRYILEDAYSSQAIGWVIIETQAAESPGPRLSLAALAEGRFLLTVVGLPHRTYKLEYADSIVSPQWRLLKVDVADPAGQFQLVDGPSPGSAQRFYRAVCQ